MSLNLKRPLAARPESRVHRLGFTLVEVLVVIAIIGVLVGMIVPAVNYARRAVQQRAIAMECQAIATAVEAYRTKFEDYPPDGADLALFTRHLRKAFPSIAPSEIQLLTRTAPFNTASFPIVSASGNNGAVMDPPEALVFFLGGFSDDPTYPLTGNGGPIYMLDNSSPAKSVTSGAPVANITSVQYNPDRKNSFFDFKQAQLTMGVQNSLTVSTEDALSGGLADLLPTYHPSGRTLPYVYFDSRTYQQTTIANRYATMSDGLVYPYRSTTVNTKYQPADTSVVSRNKYFRFMNDKTFQLISAGLDDNYGGQQGLFYMYKPTGAEGSSTANSGDSLDLVGAISGGSHPNPQFVRFQDSNGTSQADNVANFSAGTFEDSLEN